MSPLFGPRSIHWKLEPASGCGACSSGDCDETAGIEGCGIVVARCLDVMSEQRIHLDYRDTLFVLGADGLLASVSRIGQQRAEAVRTLFVSRHVNRRIQICRIIIQTLKHCGELLQGMGVRHLVKRSLALILLAVECALVIFSRPFSCLVDSSRANKVERMRPDSLSLHIGSWYSNCPSNFRPITPRVSVISHIQPYVMIYRLYTYRCEPQPKRALNFPKKMT